MTQSDTYLRVHNLTDFQWRTEGFWRRGEDGNWRPPPRRVRLARVEGALSHYLGGLLRAFWCEWNPFLNSVNTIFNSACQTGKRQKRSLSHYWRVWGGAPAANAFESILV